MMFNSLWVEKQHAYLGPELRPHYLLTQFKLEGSGIVAYCGECFVKTQDLVDYEDSMSGDFIKAKLMLHFQAEFFQWSLREAVFAQRILASIVANQLFTVTGTHFERSGDDVYFSEPATGQRFKLSVSIVTSSAVSQVLHFGLNIDATGAPVPAKGLNDFGVSVPEFAQNVLNSFVMELRGIGRACTKVRPVV